MNHKSPTLILLAGVLSVIPAFPSDDSDKVNSGRVAPKPVAGIGLVLSMIGEKLTIMKVLPGTPAAAAGLKERLVVLTVDGIPTAGKSQAECGAMVRGLPGTQVKLDLVDFDHGTKISVELTRRWVR